MSFKNDDVQVEEYVYDFAVDGGATGAIDLSGKSSESPVPVGALIKSVTMKVVTAFTSGGSATLAWGNGDDADGYSGTAIAVASLTDNALFLGNEDAAAPGALLWATIGTTPDAVKSKPALNVADANDGLMEITIAAADMTAGKAIFLVEYYMPSLA